NSNDETLKYSSLVPVDRRADTSPLYPASVVQTPNGYLKIQGALRPSQLHALIKNDPEAVHKAAKDKNGPLFVSSELAEAYAAVERSIIRDKIEPMVEYVARALRGEDIADWGPIDLVTSAQPDMTDFSSKGDIHMPSSAMYLITDGQHRCIA